MATSRVFSQTTGELIRRALLDARIIPAEQPVQQIDFERGLDSLNYVVKGWQAQDLNLWLKEEAVLPLNVGQRMYELGPDGAECADANNFYSTTLGSAAALNDTAITVADTTGMNAASDILNSDPTAGTTDWTAINGATLTAGLTITNVGGLAGGADYSLPVTVGKTYRVRFDYTLGTSSSCTFSVLNGSTVANSVTLNATTSDNELLITAVNSTITFRIENVSTTVGETSTVSGLQYVDQFTGSRIGICLDDGTRFWGNVLNVNSLTTLDLVSGITGAAAVNNTVYSYTEQLFRPLKVLNSRYASSLTASEIPSNQWSRQEYFEQPDKDSQGTVVQWYYSPQTQRGEYYVWQVANSVNSLVRFTYMKPALVYTEIEDELEPPSEWYQALKWAIAADVAPSYGIPDDRQLVLEAKAADFLEKVLGFDNEYSSMYFQPDFN